MGKLFIEQFTKQVTQYERYFSFQVWKTAKQYNILLGKEEIEDIVSDAYLTAVTKIRNDKKLYVQHVLAWFAKILFLTTMNSLRTQIRKSKLIDVKSIDEVNDAHFIYETIDHHMHDEAIQRALKKLSNDEAAVIKLIIAGYSYEKISEQMNKKEDAVRQLKSRAVKKLKKILH